VASAKEDNERYFEFLSDSLNEEVNQRFVEAAVEAARKDINNTFHRPGWLREFYKNWQDVPPDTDKRKKVVGVTVMGSGVKPTKMKSEVDMSAEEYLEHVRKQGLRI
jgi:hypothetical protein